MVHPTSKQFRSDERVNTPIDKAIVGQRVRLISKPEVIGQLVTAMFVVFSPIVIFLIAPMTGLITIPLAPVFLLPLIPLVRNWREALSILSQTVSIDDRGVTVYRGDTVEHLFRWEDLTFKGKSRWHQIRIEGTPVFTTFGKWAFSISLDRRRNKNQPNWLPVTDEIVARVSADAVYELPYNKRPPPVMFVLASACLVVAMVLLGVMGIFLRIWRDDVTWPALLVPYANFETSLLMGYLVFGFSAFAGIVFAKMSLYRRYQTYSNLENWAPKRSKRHVQGQPLEFEVGKAYKTPHAKDKAILNDYSIHLLWCKALVLLCPLSVVPKFVYDGALAGLIALGGAVAFWFIFHLMESFYRRDYQPWVRGLACRFTLMGSQVEVRYPDGHVAIVSSDVLLKPRGKDLPTARSLYSVVGEGDRLIKVDPRRLAEYDR